MAGYGDFLYVDKNTIGAMQPLQAHIHYKHMYVTKLKDPMHKRIGEFMPEKDLLL